MQCDYCESKATVFFTQIIDGNVNKSCLCEECASKHGVTDPEGFLLGDTAPLSPKKPGGKKGKKIDVPMSPTGSDQIDLPALSPEAATSKAGTGGTGICPGCGFAFDDLKKTGRLGCSKCYQFFRAEIKNNLGGMHKGICHTGRVPEGMLEAFEKRQRLEQLQTEMNEAIAAEDYEKAAALRDEIKNLSGETSLTPDS